MTAQTSQKGFTLTEIIVAITLLSFVMLSVFQIYSSIVTLSKRLNVTRLLQENARNIVESIARDVREGWIASECYVSSSNVPAGCSQYHEADYAGNGTDILILRKGTTYIKYFLMTESATVGLVACTDSDLAIPGKCFLGRESLDLSGNPVKIRISNQNAHITKLHFFLSGVNTTTFRARTDTEWKVTLSFVLSVAPKSGLSPTVIQDLKIPIQTTITEKLYKIQ